MDNTLYNTLLEHLKLPKCSSIFSKINNDNKTEETWNEKTQARHYFSRKLKWGPSDFSSEKSHGG